MSRNLLTVFVTPFIIIFLTLTIGLREVRGETNIVQTVNNGDSATHIDLAIIGSGFAEEDLDEYRTRADGNIDKMFSVNWFADNSDLFNVHRIEAVSPESGVDLDNTTINSIASKTPYDILIVLHNYDCQERATSRVDLCKYSNGYVVLAHELGHFIGELGDEYYFAGTCTGLSKMITNVHDKPNNEKWSDLISTPPYEGARYCANDLWRPSENSIMKDSANTPYFDAVGYKAMDLGAGKILGTIESISPSLQISGVQNGDSKSGILNVEAITSDVFGIERVEFYWAKAGNTSKSIKIDKIYPYDLVIDTTQYENGQYYLDTVSYDKNWNYIRVTRLFNIANSENTSILDVPIIVHEALTLDTEHYIETGKTQNMPGMDRIDEPLTVGIPLAKDSGITSINQLGLSETDLQQFRPLAYWPNGNIKWVLVDTQVDVLAEDQTIIHLENGAGNSGGSDLAVDNNDYISVNTGIAQFRIKKSNFNMIDNAVVNGKELVFEDNNGGLSITGYENTTYILHKDQTTHILKEGTVYDSKNDPDSTAIIEENGPVRTVVKAMGAFKDTDGNRLMDYTVRLHFYKDKSFVKSQMIMRHGQIEEFSNSYSGYSQNARTFSNVQINIPLNLEANKQFEFSTNKNVLSGIINDIAYMYQGYSSNRMRPSIESDSLDGKLAWYNPPMERVDPDVRDVNYIQKGLEVKNGDTILNPMGDENEWTDGYAEIEDQDNNGLTIAMQYMSGYWPASVEFTEDGNAEIGIFSKYNTKKDVAIRWGSHETREIIFDFHTASVDNTEIIYRLEQPVIGRNSIDHYNQAKAFFDSSSIVSGDQFYQFYLDNYGRIDYYHPAPGWGHGNSGVINWRTFWYSGVVGKDYPLGQLYNFIKIGNGGTYMAGLQKTLFNTDSAMWRTDGFDYSETIVGTSYIWPIYIGTAFNSPNHFDYYGHNHWRAMPYFYYLTGNEAIKEGINDYLEEFIRSGSITNFSGFGTSLRAYSRYYSTIALGYEFNKDERLKNIVEDMTDALLDSRDNPPDVKPYGRNMERGYMWLDGSYYSCPTIHSFLLISIHAQDAWQAYRVLKEYDETYQRTEELDDYLLGLGQFIYNELYFDEPEGDKSAYIYDYLLHDLNQWVYSDTAGISGNYMRNDESSRTMLHAYYNTGDKKYLERGTKILAVCSGSGTSTPFPANDLIYADLHGLSSFWSYLNNVAKVNNGSNNYTLTWTVPEGASELKIKYSDKPIVDWLGFDQMTREYEYSPDDYIAFFAATNIDDEPAPFAAGAEQSFTIDIEQAMNSYNTARNLTLDNPSYVVYDPNKTYYFAMKYEHSPESGDQATYPPPPEDDGGGDTPPEDDGGDTPPEDGGDTPPEDGGDVEDDEIRGDLDGDGDIDSNDLNILLGYRDQPASECIACDLDGDGTITVLDARKLVVTCTRPRCSCE